MKKKVLSVLLAVCLIVGALPMAASAAANQTTSVTPQGRRSVSEALGILINEIYKSGQAGNIDSKGYPFIDFLTDQTRPGSKEYVLFTLNTSENVIEFSYVLISNDENVNATQYVFFDYDIYKENIKNNTITFINDDHSFNGTSALEASINMHTHVAASDLMYTQYDGSGPQLSFSILYNLANVCTQLGWKTFEAFLSVNYGITLEDIGFFNLNPYGLPESETTAVTGVSLNKTALTMKAGETASLTATVSPSNATNTSVTWSSSDNAVASVDANGKVRAVSPGAAIITVITDDGGYTASCAVAVSPKEQQPALPTQFTDVPPGQYYVDAVKWAVENNITSGTDKTHFSPGASCTRAQAVTFLWRAAGRPEPKGNAVKFKDVKPGDYYEKAVQWAVENGITSGTGETTFSPNANCTRAQIVTFMYRAENSPEISGNNSFIDVPTGAYYENAVKWAVENNITSGTGGNKFSPNDNCIRGQIVTFLYRYKT